MASEELPLEAVEAAARAIMALESGRVEGERWDDFEPDAPELEECRRDAEAALRAAFEATGMKVERMPGLESRRKGGWQPRKLPDMYRLVSDWHPVEQFKDR